MKYVLRLFSSKYLVTLLAFAVWMAFFDARDIFSQLSRRSELKQLNAKITYYHQQIEQTRAELKNLQDDPAAKEKYAREKFFMKRDNEEIFVEQPSEEVENE
jgi:cell division protein DivIC